MQVKDMTVDDLKALIREIIAETLNEMIDPDEEKELKPEVKEYLLNLQKRKQAGRRGISGEKVFERLGL